MSFSSTSQLLSLHEFTPFPSIIKARFSFSESTPIHDLHLGEKTSFPLRRCVMAEPTAIAIYPPNPTNVPADLSEPNWAYCSRVLFVLGSLLLFIALYLGLVAGSAYLCYSSFMSLKESASPTKTTAKTAAKKSHYPMQGSNTRNRPAPRVAMPPFVHVAVMILSGLLFLFLLKNFFKFGRSPKFRYV